MRSIPPELLAKIKGQNQTIWNGTNPKMSVVVSRAKSSVRDSTYFTIEKIREKEGITDVAVSARRRQPIGPPDRIYGIHIDNGMAKASLREYPDKLKEHWKPQFDVESAIGVSIVFDGRWHMNYKKTWGLVTDELPWIFWIDSSNNLKARIWNTGDIYTLSTNVSKVDTVRGWIPAQAGHTDDQGIIAAYVKTDGKIYYRNYCMQSTGIFIWETEKEMTDFGAGCTGVRLFRTNDFRVGFLAEKPTGNMMAITVRNWAGMSIAPEKIALKIDGEIQLNPINFIEGPTVNEHLTLALVGQTNFCDADLLDIEPVELIRKSKSELELVFNTALYEVNHKEAFEVLDKQGIKEFEITDITYDNGNLTLLVEPDIEDEIDIRVVYTSGIDKILVSNNEVCVLELGSFEIDSDGERIPPERYFAEHITMELGGEIILNDIVYFNSYAKEYISLEVTGNIKLYDLDDAPL